MSEYVIVGGSRKNPAIEKINHSGKQSMEQQQSVIAEMKAVVFGVGSEEILASPNANLAILQRTDAPDIPLCFNGSV